jgi:2-polyprenyl-3-methyl-5-hydroxy-6-metoxy-1,4-benzoquinol methylase
MDVAGQSELDRSIDEAVGRTLDRFRPLHPRHKWYARSKVRWDPCYRAVARHVPPGTLTVDVGSGIGILAAVLAELGEGRRIHGIEHDARKFSASVQATSGLATVSLVKGDILSVPIPECQVVTSIDVLHYIEPEQQVGLLRRVADALPSGGLLLMRETDGARRGGVWFTKAFDRISMAIGWNRGATRHFRSRAEWTEVLAAAGFGVAVSDLSGRMNPGNVLLVARKA